MKNIYVFKSTREGVEKPVERKITNVIKGVSFRGKEKVPVDRYKLDGDYYPYEVDIVRGETSTKDDGYGTGVGDLWSWSYFSSFSLDEAKKHYQKELERVVNNKKNGIS